MATTRSVRLSSAPSVQEKRARRATSQAPTPDQRLYGVFGPSYAGYLQQTAGAQGPQDSAALAALNAFALRNEAQKERSEYAAMLGKAQEVQERMARDAIHGDLMEDVAGRGPAWADKGMLGVESIGIDPETGRPYIQYDPTHQQVGNANVLNNDQADRFNTYMGALKTGREAGIAIPDDYIGQVLTPPTQVEPVPVTTGTAPLTPKDATDLYGQDEGMSVEEQIQYATIKGTKEDGSDDVKVVVTRNDKGDVSDVKFEGNPDALRRRGIDPDTGLKLNPNAAPQGGGGAATKAAKPKTTERIHIVPSEGFFASDKITSKKGMRRHPILGVNRMHEGDDYAYPKGTPIPAERNGVVLFSGPVKGYGNQVKVRYEDGSVVSYSHNAANTVKIGDKVQKGQVIGKVGSTGLSTGNHVHRQVHSQGNPEKVYATRVRNHPLVVDVKVVDDKTLVTMRDGTQRVYQKGRRVGG